MLHMRSIIQVGYRLQPLAQTIIAFNFPLRPLEYGCRFAGLLGCGSWASKPRGLRWLWAAYWAA